MNFHPQTTIKGQILLDFIAEFTYSNTAEVTRMTNIIEIVKATWVREKENSVPTEGDAEQWTLYMDNASNDTGSGAGMMLICLEGHKIHYSVSFGFKELNNKAEYEALIAGMRLVLEL